MLRRVGFTVFAAFFAIAIKNWPRTFLVPKICSCKLMYYSQIFNAMFLLHKLNQKKSTEFTLIQLHLSKNHQKLILSGRDISVIQIARRVFSKWITDQIRWEAMTLRLFHLVRVFKCWQTGLAELFLKSFYRMRDLIHCCKLNRIT